MVLYYLYKLPKEASERDSPTNGLRYAYVSSKDDAGPDHTLQWHSARYDINQSESAPGRTIVPSTDHPATTLTILYNDEPTNGPVDMERGHTKGVVSTDGTTGYWLIHSVPKFPPAIGVDYSYPHTGMLYGQSFLCISLNATQMETVGRQLLFNEVTAYSTSIPAALAARFPTLTRAARMEPADKSPPFYSQQTVRSRAGVKFVTFAKSRHFGKELYADWIAPTLDTGLMVESWQHGTGNLPSECFTDRRHSVWNVREVSVGRADRFTTLNDHSKWAVGGGEEVGKDGWICVGDINRQEHQKQRGGGSVCQALIPVAKLYWGMIDAIEPCPKIAVNRGSSTSTSKSSAATLLLRSSSICRRLFFSRWRRFDFDTVAKSISRSCIARKLKCARLSSPSSSISSSSARRRALSSASRSSCSFACWIASRSFCLDFFLLPMANSFSSKALAKNGSFRSTPYGRSSSELSSSLGSPTASSSSPRLRRFFSSFRPLTVTLFIADPGGRNELNSTITSTARIRSQSIWQTANLLVDSSVLSASASSSPQTCSMNTSSSSSPASESSSEEESDPSIPSPRAKSTSAPFNRSLIFEDSPAFFSSSVSSNPSLDDSESLPNRPSMARSSRSRSRSASCSLCSSSDSNW
uniref:Uncharacterized protein n=1 Tax=Anopheles culicifacies TaxID=139723 RepID=A0A182LT51_9DIPT